MKYDIVLDDKQVATLEQYLNGAETFPSLQEVLQHYVEKLADTRKEDVLDARWRALDITDKEDKLNALSP